MASHGPPSGCGRPAAAPRRSQQRRAKQPLQTASWKRLTWIGRRVPQVTKEPALVVQPQRRQQPNQEQQGRAAPRQGHAVGKLSSAAFPCSRWRRCPRWAMRRLRVLQPSGSQQEKGQAEPQQVRRQQRWRQQRLRCGGSSTSRGRSKASCRRQRAACSTRWAPSYAPSWRRCWRRAPSTGGCTMLVSCHVRALFQQPCLCATPRARRAALPASHTACRLPPLPHTPPVAACARCTAKVLERHSGAADAGFLESEAGPVRKLVQRYLQHLRRERGAG